MAITADPTDRQGQEMAAEENLAYKVSQKSAALPAYIESQLPVF
jgi:hypothetical protein